MEIIFAFIAGILIVLSFKFVSKYFNEYYFSYSDIFTDKFSLRNFLLSFAVPFMVSFGLGYFLHSSNKSLYLIPGLLSSLLITWPNIITPYLIPPELQKDKQKLYAIYALFITSFTSLGYAGGLFGLSQNSTALFPSRQGLIDGVWVAIGLAILSYFAGKIIKK